MGDKFPEHIERWRSLVAKYFRPEDVDRALMLIMRESNGRPDTVSYGLFQYHDSPGIALASGDDWLEPEDEDAYWYELMTGEREQD